VAENYPQLQAVQNFKQMQADLTDTEDKIQFARRFYNGNVRDYNTALMTFPTNLLGQAFGFTAEQYFQVDEPADRAVPQVKFTTSVVPGSAPRECGRELVGDPGRRRRAGADGLRGLRRAVPRYARASAGGGALADPDAARPSQRHAGRPRRRGAWRVRATA